jgi:hypothetical protein
MTGHDLSPAEGVPSHDQSPENDLLTLTEATRRFAVSESTLRRALSQGKVEGAVQRKGPKGSYWLIPAGALEALGYGPQEADTAPGEGSPADSLRVQLEAVQALLEAERVTAAELREADRKVHAAEVDRLTSSLDYERQLRESAEGRATLAEDAARIAATLAASTHQELERTRSRLLELEAGPKSGRWWKRSKKQAPTTPPNA